MLSGKQNSSRSPSESAHSESVRTASKKDVSNHSSPPSSVSEEEQSQKSKFS